MSKVIQYYCDRCGKYKSSEELFFVTRIDTWDTGHSIMRSNVECHICTDCAKSGTLYDLSYEAKPKEVRPV